MRKFGFVIIVVLFLLFMIGSSIYMDLLIYADQPAGRQTAEKLVVLNPGQGFKAFTQQLYAKGIIQDRSKFELLAFVRGDDKRIKAGEYSLSAAMTPRKILELLVSGKVRLYKITIPEGYNLRQIAKLVGRTGLTTETDFLTAATDSELVRSMGIDAASLEGYLFPETYYFPKNLTPEKIISTMVNRFWLMFKPEWKQQAQTLGLSIHQIVTLASIIEKETGAAFERPLISSVFHNRLQRKMRLESDPTVIYGLEDYNGNLTRKHLNTPTPYNTYIIRGLPPGPIANPGVEALKAALYPADTKLLYFVSKKDRTHQFSTNIADHNRAVQKYQLHK